MTRRLVSLFLLIPLAGMFADSAPQSGHSLAKQKAVGSPLDVHVLTTGIASVKFESLTSSNVVGIAVPKDDVEKTHTAFIAADADFKLDVPDFSKQKVTYQYTIAGQKHYFDVFWLDGADNVPLAVQDLVATTQTSKEVEPGGLCGDVTDTSNLYFIPRLNRVLQGNTCTPSNDVSMQLDTPGGTFSAYVANPLVEQFRPPLKLGGRMHSQQVAQLVDWFVRTSDSSLTLVSKKDGVARPFATAQPYSGRVVIVIGSAPRNEMSDAISPPAKTAHHPPQPNTSDPHWHIYYRACPGIGPIPETTYINCGSAKVPDFAPLWMQENSKVFVSARAFGGKYMRVRKVIGGLNCGPDGQP